MATLDTQSEAAEFERLRLERQKLALDVLLKRRELSLRSRSFLREVASNPLTLAITGAILTVLGTIVGNYLNTRAELQVERERIEAQKTIDEHSANLEDRRAEKKLQTDLLLRYAQADNPDQARENLKFLIGAGLLSDYPQIEGYLEENPDASPRVSTGGGSLTNPIVGKMEAEIVGQVQQQFANLADSIVNTLSTVSSRNNTHSQVASGRSRRLIGEFKAAIAFVVDTSSAMEPYLNDIRLFVRGITSRLQQLSISDQISFGLVGYRDYMGLEPQRSGVGARLGCPGLEYVSEIYLGLDVEQHPAAIIGGFDLMNAACIGSRGWKRDAVAGLYRAITDLDWDPFSLRMVILITSASARDVGDEFGAYQDLGIAGIKELAISKDIAIIPIHLRTPDAILANDIAEAQDQYTQLALTGDPNVQKYFPIEGSP